MEQLHLLRQAILDSLAQQDSSGLRVAVQLCEQLPPGTDPDGIAIDCLYAMAHAFDQIGDYPTAETLYLRALSYDDIPSWIAANMRYRAGICMQMQGKTDPAIGRHFESAVDQSERCPDVRQLARYSLACLLLTAGDLRSADEHFRMLAEEPELVIPALDLLSRYLLCVVRLGTAETAGRICEQLPPIPPQADLALVQTLFDAAQAAENSRLYDLAEKIYLKLLECSDLLPSLRANARFRLGFVLEYQSRWLESMDHYRAAIQGSATCPEIGDLSRFHLSLLFMAAEEYEEAAALHEELAQCSSFGSQPDVRVRHAICLLECGETDAAERILMGLDDAPTPLKARIDQLLAAIHEGRENYRSAATCYERIVQNPCAEFSIRWAAIQRKSTINRFLRL